MQLQNYFVYILTNQRHTVLYIGITNDLARRLWEHGEGVASSFTRQYNVNKLIYFGSYSDPLSAISREKQFKNWSRSKKETLIAGTNSEWRDLGREMFEPHEAQRGPSASLRSARDDDKS